MTAHDKAMGDERECETSSGALAPHPGSLVGPDNARRRGLFGSPYGEARLERNLHKPLARIAMYSRTERSRGKRRVMNSPTSLTDTVSADSSQSSAEEPEADTTIRSPSSEITTAARLWWNSVVTGRRTKMKTQVMRSHSNTAHTTMTFYVCAGLAFLLSTHFLADDVK